MKKFLVLLFLFCVICLAQKGRPQQFGTYNLCPDAPSANDGLLWSAAFNCWKPTTTVNKPPCSASITTNCVPTADASGNVAIATTLPGAATASGTIATWAKYTVDVSSNAGFWTVNGTKGAALDADGSQQVALVTLPAKTVLHGIVIEHTVAFAGGAVSAATVSVGTATSPTLLSDAYNVFQAITALPYQNGGLSVGRRTSATLALVVQADTTGGNLSALTAGTVNVYLLTSVLP